MPRPEHHPLALFSLIPVNEGARAVLAHQCNEHLVSWLTKGILGLDIGHVRSKFGDKTLATIGRGDADIIVADSRIAKIQCSFEIDLETKVVIFYDRSHSQTSQVFGQYAMPFQPGCTRKVVVQDNVNTLIGMGGEGRNLVQFELAWHCKPNVAIQMNQNRENTILSYEENPRLAWTIDEADTVLPSCRETRPHTTRLQQSKLRYATIVQLGAGKFGEVYKAVDVDSGKLMAVKILKQPPGTSDQDWRISVYNTFKREVDILSRISHLHVVEFIASRGWNEGQVEIFMSLKEGALQSLVEGRCSTSITDIGTTVVYHMLQALDFLAVNGIVHRDVMPENILYTSQPGKYHFQLWDFGLSNRQAVAASFVGSSLYMAPKMFQRGMQTHKADVWSLYVTMLWTLDVEGFRKISKSFKTPDDARTAILLVASKADSVLTIQEMARINPEERASAAQMLIKCFNGQGLSTPGNQVLPLQRPFIVNSKASPYPTHQHTNQRDLQSKVNPPIATGYFRVEKARSPQAQLKRAIRPSPGALLNNVSSTLAEARQPPRHT